ncbi:MAG: 50S ribosomal protein L10 [Planctomycetota bacterium]
MPNRANQMLVDEYLKSYKGIKGIVMVKSEKLNSEDQVQTRAKATDGNLRVLMVRNRLSAFALKQLYQHDVSGLFDGSTLILDNADPIYAAKTAVALCRTKQGLTITGGIMDGEVCTAAEVEAWATRDDLPTTLSKIMGLLVGPSQAMLAILNSGAQGIAGGLHAYNEKREKEGTAQAS